MARLGVWEVLVWIGLILDVVMLKMSIVVEERDETVFWLEILKDSDIKCDKSRVESLIPEANKICAVMAKARSNTKR